MPIKRGKLASAAPLSAATRQQTPNEKTSVRTRNNFGFMVTQRLSSCEAKCDPYYIRYGDMADAIAWHWPTARSSSMVRPSTTVMTLPGPVHSLLGARGGLLFRAKGRADVLRRFKCSSVI